MTLTQFQPQYPVTVSSTRSYKKPLTTADHTLLDRLTSYILQKLPQQDAFCAML